MLHGISLKIANWLFKELAYDERYDICVYAIELLIYSIISTLGLIVIGWLCNELMNSVMIICVFYGCQTVGGGLHASSHTKCFLVMALFLLIGLQLCKVYRNNYLIIITTAISIVILYKRPLVLHNNKKYLESRSTTIIFVSRLWTVICSVGFVFALNSCERLTSAFSIGLAFSALSRAAASGVWRKESRKGS